MLPGNNKMRIQSLSKKKETTGSCFPMLQNKTIWKLKINDNDYKISLITHKILPKKQLFVNDVLQEVSNTFGDFKFFFYLQGQLLTVSQKKKATNLLINKNPFYSFQDLPEDSPIEKSKRNPSSLDQIDLENTKQRISRPSIKIISQKTLELGLNDKDKEKRNPSSLDEINIEGLKDRKSRPSIKFVSPKSSLELGGSNKDKENEFERKVTSQKALEFKEEESSTLNHLKEKSQRSLKDLEIKEKDEDKDLKEKSQIHKGSEIKYLKDEGSSKLKDLKEKNQRNQKNSELKDLKEESQIRNKEESKKLEENASKLRTKDHNKNETKTKDDIPIEIQIRENSEVVKKVKSQEDEEMKMEISKMKEVLKPNINIDRLVKDNEIIRRNLWKINKRIDEFLSSGSHATILFENKAKIISVYQESQFNIKQLKAKEKNNVILSCLSDLEMNIEETLKKLNEIKDKLRVANSPISQDQCVICMEKKVTHACVPCGHLKYCEKCIEIIINRKECAICRTQIQSVYHIFT